MSRVLDRESVLFCLAEQTLGFEFGTPERVDDKSLAVVLPVLRHSTTPRTYTTYPETDKLKVKDSGAIDTMIAHNEGDLAVFLRSGTIFKGATQERAAQRSNIILAGASVNIKVRCIHATRGITGQAEVKYGRVTPLMFDQQVYSGGYAPKAQSEYWRSATMVNCCMTSSMNSQGGEEGLRQRIERANPDAPFNYTEWLLRSQGYSRTLERPVASDYASFVNLGDPALSGSDDLSGTYDAFTEQFDEVLSKVKLVDDQVGLALINEAGCQTIEVFDAHASWKALHEDAVRRLGPNMAQKDKGGVFEYRPDKAVEVVQRVLALPFKSNLIYEHKPNNGDPGFTVHGLSAENYTGEVVEFDGKAIHLTILKLAA